MKSLALLLIFAPFFSCVNTGVETGNPITRYVIGKFHNETTSSQLVKSAQKYAENSTEYCEIYDLITIEARATDLSVITTGSILNGEFKMKIDSDKAFVFSVFGRNKKPCGYLVFDNEDDFKRKRRAIIGAGAENIDLGNIIQKNYFSFYVENDPAKITDADGDSITDFFDEDINGDGLIDFDGNYDDFINVNDPTDLMQSEVCDFQSIEGEQRAEYGTVSLDFERGTLVFLANQEIKNIDLNKMSLYNVDLNENDTTLSNSSLTLTGTTAKLTLELLPENDYVLTLPAKTLSCESGDFLNREIQLYFRATAFGQAFSM